MSVYHKRSNKRKRDLDIEQATDFWNRVGPRTFEEAAEFIYGAVKNTYPDAHRAKLLGNWCRATWFWCWANDGFFTLTSPSDYAAALMLTDYPESSVELLQPPARAFRVRVPDGLLKAKGGNKDGSDFLLKWIHVGPAPARFEGGSEMLGYFAFFGQHQLGSMKGAGPAFRGGNECSFVDLLSTTPSQMSTEHNAEDWGDLPLHKSTRASAVDLATRYVAGLLMQLQFTPHSKESTKKYTSAKLNDRGSPEHRNVVVGSPISVNVKPAINMLLSGKKTRKKVPLAHQYCVRGHPRNQAFGPKHTLRKLIWVEPYWKGPKNAPILVRPHNIEGSD